MFHDVLQAFLGNPEDAQFQIARQTRKFGRNGHLDLNSIIVLKCFTE